MADYFDEDDDVVLGRQDRDESSDDGGRTKQKGKGKPGSKVDNPGAGGEGKEGTSKEAAAPTRKRPSQPRPKLTLEMLMGENGFPHVYSTLLGTLRPYVRGKGHEVSDLQLLLEAYQRWQQRIFPHCSFDEFLVKVEKFSNNRMMQNDLRKMRDDLINGLEVDSSDDGQDDDLLLQPYQHTGVHVGEDDAGNTSGGGAGTTQRRRNPADRLDDTPPRLRTPSRHPNPFTAGTTAANTTAAGGRVAGAVGMGLHLGGVGGGARQGGGGAGVAVPVNGGGGGGGAGGDVDEEWDDELLAMQAAQDWDVAHDVLDEIEMDMDHEQQQQRPQTTTMAAAAPAPDVHVPPIEPTFDTAVEAKADADDEAAALIARVLQEDEAEALLNDVIDSDAADAADHQDQGEAPTQAATQEEEDGLATASQARARRVRAVLIDEDD